jgi:hypothetical protein
LKIIECITPKPAKKAPPIRERLPTDPGSMLPNESSGRQKAGELRQEW